VNGLALKDREFQQFQAWLHATAGIHMSPAKKALVAGRLSKRLRHHSLDSYGDYFKLISSQEGAAESLMALDMLTTHETYFFREPKHFDFLREQVLPHASSTRPFRVWSAACSSGEEPYSLAMTLADALGNAPWEVLASDISTQVLAKARAGHYPMERARNLSHDLLSRHCLKGIGRQAGTLLVERRLRERVQFSRINLNETLPRLGDFDVIMLRNVMIYFDLATKRQVVQRLLPMLRKGGYFLISHSESLNGVCDHLEVISPSIYRKP
jgi:chemotaxis protein methyltransferase CheR